jgi:hypothetical protein
VANSVRFHFELAAQLSEAIAWYEAKSPGVANRFRAAVRRGFQDVKKYPNLHPLALGNNDIRFRRVGKFPYLILYRVTPNALHFVGIVHSASDPSHWRLPARDD